MSHKTWSFTSYRDGKPVGTEHGLDHDEALAAIRAAMSGEPVLRAVETAREPVKPVELAHAA